MVHMRDASPSERARRTEIDLAIKRDGELLSEVAMLLNQRGPLGDWPPAPLAALADALRADHGNRQEVSKARRLVRHLFVDMPPPVLRPSMAVPGRWADRLRADLPDMVPFAAGLHLIDDDALV